MKKLESVVTLQILPAGKIHFLPLSKETINIFPRKFLLRDRFNEGIQNLDDEHQQNKQNPKIKYLPFEK
jgi:hypothetical protein